MPRLTLRSTVGSLLGLLLVAAQLDAASSSSRSRESKKLERLLDQAWQAKLRDRPEYATYIGYPGHNHRWTDFSAGGIERRRAQTREQVRAAQAIERGLLSPDEQVDLKLFVRRLESQIEGFSYLEDELAITRYDGIQKYVPQVFAIAPANSVRGYEDLIARLGGVAALVDQTIFLLQKGLSARATPPKDLLVGVPEQVRQLIPDDPWQSPLLARFRQVPAEGVEMEDEDAARLRGAALHAYQSKAAPALRRLLAYLETTYIPAARESLGVGVLPNGAAWYAYLLRKATTTTLTPDQIHELGLAEARRIRGEMDRVIATTGFVGSYAEFVTFLHTDPRFIPTNAENLMNGYGLIEKAVEARLSTIFGKIPALPLRLAAVPPEQGVGRSTIYYDIGSVARGVAGTCYVNTFDLRARPTWERTALFLHECLPGHHLQVSIAQSIRKAPKVLNYHDYTPFVEGWGVYAETLGDDLGLYRDPYSKFGQLASELWRVMRVVVDTGIHAKGWTRERARAYFRENTAQDERAIDNEIERYLYEPALGVAYTIGALEFRNLRALAERELGAAFDLRAFHDEVLAHGALPLDLLAANVEAWIAARKRHAQAAAEEIRPASMPSPRRNLRSAPRAPRGLGRRAS